jgi:hypothetical protein
MSSILGIAGLPAVGSVIGAATSASADTAADQYCIITVAKSAPGGSEGKVIDRSRERPAK